MFRIISWHYTLEKYMTTIQNFNPVDILMQLSWDENEELELKSAKGGLPKSLWETYSAMANSNGGVIILGVEDDGFVNGLENLWKIKKNFWDTINNRGKISVNLLMNEDVQELSIDNKKILLIQVPRASRTQRPVFIGQNPLTGTYRRNFEGDYKCSEQEVGRMLSDRSEEPADRQILEGYSFADLDEQSINQYRNLMTSYKPTHVWLAENDQVLLRKLGGWRKDRITKQEGLTVAGLLMFGTEEAICEAFPQYHLDYREKLAGNSSSTRWTDRFTVDGTWTPNLLQFYLKVSQRISQDLKLPFALNKDLFRKGETKVHEAVREALVNSIIHSDYKGVGGIIVEKYKNKLDFSNPGCLLVSMEQLLRGNVSECRNKSLQKMFMMIGASEKAGSGVDKIIQGWRSQHWRQPMIREQVQPDRVLWSLPMISLLPEESIERLNNLFDEKAQELTPLETQALVTADIEKEVTNNRLCQITQKHPSDVTKLLQLLVRKGFLIQKGQGRWTKYHLAGSEYCREDFLFDEMNIQKGLAQEAHDDVQEAHDGTQEAHDEAQEAHDEAQEAHDEAQEAHDEAQEAHDETQEAHDEAQKAHDEAQEAHDEAHDEAQEAHDEAQKAHDEAQEAHDEAQEAHDEAHDEAQEAHDETQEAHDEAQEVFSPTEKKIIYLCKKQVLSRQEIAKELGVKPKAGNVRKALINLQKQSILQYTIPDKPKSKKQKYQITERGFLLDI